MTTPESTDQNDSAVTTTPTEVERAAEIAGATVQRGMNAVQAGSQRLRDSALQVNEQALRYIQTEPVKAMLIAAAAGAALVALAGLLGRPPRARHVR